MLRVLERQQALQLWFKSKPDSSTDSFDGSFPVPCSRDLCVALARELAFLLATEGTFVWTLEETNWAEEYESLAVWTMVQRGLGIRIKGDARALEFTADERVVLETLLVISLLFEWGTELLHVVGDVAECRIHTRGGSLSLWAQGAQAAPLSALVSKWKDPG